LGTIITASDRSVNQEKTTNDDSISKITDTSADSKELVPSLRLRDGAANPIKDFLITGRAFGRLRLAVRHIIQQNPMDAISEEVYYGMKSVKDDFVQARFHVYWEIRDYISRELNTIKGLGSIFTISGGPRSAFATAYNEHMRWLWPNTEFDLLEAMVLALTRGIYGTFYYIYTMYVVRADWLVESERAFLSIVSPPSEHGRPGSDMVVSILGTKEVIKALAEQLAWLSAVFRMPKSDQLTLSHVEFMCISQGAFKLRLIELEEIGTKQSACWHPLVKGSLIASDFPIPDRQGEIGLELPFQAMV
jgi:hypothetical protein